MTEIQTPTSNLATKSQSNKTASGISPKKRRSKTLLNFWLDATLMIVFVTLGIVAVIVQFVFPPGVAARGWILWGMNYGEWCGLQFGLLSTMALGVLVHVMLHWIWVCGVISRRLMKLSKLPDDGIRTIYGVGLLIVLLNVAGIVIAIAKLSLNPPAG